MFKAVVLLNICVETMIDLLFNVVWWIERLKEQYLFETEIFYNIIHLFTVTFDQFNASLLNKTIFITFF